MRDALNPFVHDLCQIGCFVQVPREDMIFLYSSTNTKDLLSKTAAKSGVQGPFFV